MTDRFRTETNIESFFADGNEFEDVLNTAEEKAYSEFQKNFVDQWRRKWADYGLRAFMTKRQHETLHAIAEMDV